MTKEEFIAIVLPQFKDEGDKLVIVDGSIKFIKVAAVGHITISELTADGEYREYYKQEKKKRNIYGELQSNIPSTRNESFPNVINKSDF